MAFNFYKCRVIEKSVDLNFCGTRKNYFQATEFHIFIPWQNARVPNLMYQLKSQLQKSGKSYIPFMNSDFSSGAFDLNHYEKIKEQIFVKGREVHLIMSNKSSIHVFRVADIHISAQSSNELPLECFSLNDYSCYFEVDDLFVLEVNHLDDELVIEERLEKFLAKEQASSIFKPLINYHLQANSNCTKWINRERSLTYEYLVHSRELKNNIFHVDWDSLAISTQHELVNFELQKQKALGFRGEDKWFHLEKSFDSYEESIISELNDIYIAPMINSLFRFESLIGAWKVTSESEYHGKSDIIVKLLEGEQLEVTSIEEFIEFINHAKSFYYSLKKQFTKKIDKEEFLIVEKFLSRQESLVDSFHCKNLLEKIQLVLDIKAWIKNLKLEQVSVENLNSKNLKLSHFLNILISTSVEDNIFYHLIAEKIGRAVLKASLQEQVKALIELETKKIA